MINPRKDILKIEKKLFNEHKRIIDDSTVVSDLNFKKYWRHYKYSIRSYKKTCDLKDIHKKIETSDIVLVGDYHTLDQSQRSFIRHIKSILKKSSAKNIIVALETIQHRHQKYLDEYTCENIDTEQFIRKIGFKKHWFFDLWPNYEIIFDFLKYHEIPIYAIDADHRKNITLKKRDEFMAKHIIDLHKKYPGHKIFVLVGDLHLAKKHLPKEILNLCKKQKIAKPEILSLYQNSPSIYWKLSEEGLVDHVQFVQISDNEYCRMHTPPLIVQQSYLNWLYHEEGTFDWIDPKSNFLDIVQQICQILDFKIPKNIEQIEVYTCGDLSFLENLKEKKIFSAKEMQFINYQIRHENSYFLPQARMVYIANVSIHHAAEEASHYLKFLLSGEEFPRHRKDAFYANVLHEALGFFGSKLINAKRKCLRYSDFINEKKFLEHTGLDNFRALDYDTALLFIEHWQRLKKDKTLIHTNKIANMSSELFLAITHALGYDLGDWLYFGFMAGKITKNIIHELYCDRFEQDGEPVKAYLNLFEKLKSVKRPRYH